MFMSSSAKISGVPEELVDERLGITTTPVVSAASQDPANQVTVFSVKDMGFHYSAFQALSDVNMDIYANQVTALIGPSGCGKTTFIRCLNRMNDLVSGTRVSGSLR